MSAPGGAFSSPATLVPIASARALLIEQDCAVEFGEPKDAPEDIARKLAAFHPHGLIVRAGSRDGEICKVLGVDVARVWLMVFGIGSAIAGLSGVLAAPTRAVNPEMGIHVLAESFVVTVVGGMGSLPGAVLAGLLVGIVFSLTSLFAPDLAELSIFVLMAVVLLIRPQGLFGRAE